MTIPTTLSQYLFEAEVSTGDPKIAGIRGLIEDVAVACKSIAHECSRGVLRGVSGYAHTENVQGEAQKQIDVLANDIFIAANRWGGHVSALISEEMEDAWIPPKAYQTHANGDFLLFFDPLDGSSNSDVNVSVGSIFSVMRVPKGMEGKDYDPDWALREGTHQVAAGFTVYGPCTTMVLTLGHGTHIFTLDNDLGEFIHTHANVQVPKDAREFAINASNARFWEPPVKHYIAECLAGKTGPREKDFNMRWVASLVAETYRILLRGGIFLYPKDNKDPSKAGRLRLMYEGNPIAMIIEQASGKASTGRGRVMEVNPNSLHDRVALIFGSENEVTYVEKLHQEITESDSDMPLFQSRVV